MVRSKLRSLERKLVLERAEQRVGFHVDRLVQDWDLAAAQEKPRPDPLEFIKDLLNEGIYLPTYPRALNYLDECRREERLPEARRLMQILVAWYR